MSAIPPAAYPSDDDIAEGNSSAPAGAMLGAAIEDQALGKGVFLLVLNNGTSHAVTDYWFADSYLEYISPDGTCSHILLEALDLQNTVIQNAPRGLPFVLRSTPAQNRQHCPKSPERRDARARASIPVLPGKLYPPASAHTRNSLSLRQLDS
jgi:hypothetical protein